MVVLVVIVLGISFAVPTKDFPETAYDESVASTPLVAIVVTQVAASKAQDVLSAVLLKPGAPSWITLPCINIAPYSPLLAVTTSQSDTTLQISCLGIAAREETGLFVDNTVITRNPVTCEKGINEMVRRVINLMG